MLRWFAALVLFAAPVAQAQVSVPETARSRAAEARAAPPLRAALERQGLALGAPVYLQITKRPAELTAFVRGADGAYVRFKTWPVCAASGGLGPKLREGDGQAPEGFYTVAPRQMNPASSYHLSFDLGFPNAYDRAQGRTGSFLMVHGACVSIGCYAMTDPAIEEIWTLMAAAMRAGQGRVPVHVFPFPMDQPIPADDPNAAFWAGLKPGWDAFAQTQRPPRILIRDGRYLVQP